MIENPADLHILWIALRYSLDPKHGSTNPVYIERAKSVLAKVERLRAEWESFQKRAKR